MSVSPVKEFYSATSTDVSVSGSMSRGGSSAIMSLLCFWAVSGGGGGGAGVMMLSSFPLWAGHGWAHTLHLPSSRCRLNNGAISSGGGVL